MLILALDATGARCAAALFDREIALGATSEALTRGHAQRLFALVEAVMNRARVAPKDLDAIAVCTGPSGFTGARIGVAAARGLALALGRPAIGIHWLEALAAGRPGRCVAALPASGGWAVQRFEDGAPLGAPALRAQDDPGRAPAQGETLVGLETLAAAGLAPLARLAAARLARDPSPPPPAPLYLRPPDAAPSARPAPLLIERD